MLELVICAIMSNRKYLSIRRRFRNVQNTVSLHLRTKGNLKLSEFIPQEPDRRMNARHFSYTFLKRILLSNSKEGARLMKGIKVRESTGTKNFWSFPKNLKFILSIKYIFKNNQSI